MVVVVLQDGQRIRGELVEERADAVVLRIANVETEIRREYVRSVIRERPPRERYEEMRAIIDDDDVDRLLVLIDWLRRQRLFEEAALEARRVLEIEPGNAFAKRALELIEKQIELRDKARPEADADAEDAGDAAPDGRRRRQRREFPMLTPEQVNLYKVYEVDLSDPPRLIIDRSVAERLIERYGDALMIPPTREAREAFLQREPVEILSAMFEARARELYDQVRVVGLPSSLKRFRDDLHATWLVNACATTRCHGGDEAGRLQLQNRRPTSERSFITNLFILERFHLADGTPLLDFDVPDRSGLLQLGLPRDIALRPHPAVRGWRPVFRSRDERRFLEAVEWMRSMHRPRPDHPIDYAPPGRSEPPPRGGPDR